MQIKELMTKGVVIISADSSVMTAAEAMKSNDVGALPVQDEGVLKGMLTDRDIVVRAVAEGRNPHEVSVSDIMSTNLVVCFEDQSVEEVAGLMKSKQIRRVVVLNRDENPVGMVSLGDIAAHANVKLAAETLEKVTEPAHSK